jgi:hypothetical protein
MTQTQETPQSPQTTKARLAPVAPGSETAKKSGAVPNRKRRYSFFEDRKDFVLLVVEQQSDGKPKPDGALKPVVDLPRFTSATEAKAWVQASGAKLAGLTVMVVRMCHKLRVLVESQPLVSVFEETRFQKDDDEASCDEASGDEE